MDYYDSRDYGFWWETPEETFNDGFGFCYDLAAFALYGPGSSGLTGGQLLFVAWGRWVVESSVGHFVCIHCVGESYYSIDSGVLKAPYSFEQLLFEGAGFTAHFNSSGITTHLSMRLQS